jgi:hypothetical protein
MRRGSLLLILGALLVVVGATESWYYATNTYPAQESQAEKNCLSFGPPAPCISLSPATDQGPYVLGELAAAVGAILVFFGGLRFILAPLRPPPNPRSGPGGS